MARKKAASSTGTPATRVVAKAEKLGDKSNPRFVVTSFSQRRWETRALYEKLYCARSDMENRIKEQQLDMFAGRTSARIMRANQLRLWFSSVAYVLMNLLRRFGLKLLKLGAIVRVSVRRIVLSQTSLDALLRVREKRGGVFERDCRRHGELWPLPVGPLLPRRYR